MSDIQGEVNIMPRIAGEFKYPRNGDSAYQIALKHNFIGTEEQWLASLKGEQGEQGTPGINGSDGINGKDGYSPVKGTDYWTEADKAAIEKHCDEYIDTHITQAIGGAY